jgi:hypothetical protein
MKGRAAWVAWSLCAMYLVLVVVSQILLVVNGRARAPSPGSGRGARR